MKVKKIEWKTVLAKSDIFLPFGQKGRRSFPKKRSQSEKKLKALFEKSPPCGKVVDTVVDVMSVQ